MKDEKNLDSLDLKDIENVDITEENSSTDLLEDILSDLMSVDLDVSDLEGIKVDKTEFAKEYSIEEEIQGLKEIISYLNDKNQFKKALIYQRRLVKLAREENIKPHREADLKQRTLSDF